MKLLDIVGGRLDEGFLDDFRLQHRIRGMDKDDRAEMERLVAAYNKSVAKDQPGRTVNLFNLAKWYKGDLDAMVFDVLGAHDHGEELPGGGRSGRAGDQAAMRIINRKREEFVNSLKRGDVEARHQRQAKRGFVSPANRVAPAPTATPAAAPTATPAAAAPAASKPTPSASGQTRAPQSPPAPAVGAAPAATPKPPAPAQKPQEVGGKIYKDSAGSPVKVGSKVRVVSDRGDIRTGTVTNVADQGVYVRINGEDGNPSNRIATVTHDSIAARKDRLTVVNAPEPKLNHPVNNLIHNIRDNMAPDKKKPASSPITAGAAYEDARNALRKLNFTKTEIEGALNNVAFQPGAEKFDVNTILTRALGALGRKK
jgi:hypothetical protein